MFEFSGIVAVTVPSCCSVVGTPVCKHWSSHDVAVIGLFGHFTQIMQYRVGTECVHAWSPSAL